MSVDLLRQAARNSLREVDASRNSLTMLIELLDTSDIELEQLPALSDAFLKSAEDFGRAFRILEQCGAQYQQFAQAEIGKHTSPPSGKFAA